MMQMQGMMQQMAEMLKTGSMSPEQMKRMGELMEQMTAQMGQAHDIMAGMGAGGRDPAGDARADVANAAAHGRDDGQHTECVAPGFAREEMRFADR